MQTNSLAGSLSTARSERGIGFVDYVEDGRSIPFWCRRGGGKFLAYIYCPHATKWQTEHAWALERKSEITELVIAHFRGKFPACRIVFETDAIVAFIRTDEPVA